MQYTCVKVSGGVRILAQEENALVLAAPEEAVVTGAVSLISFESAETACALRRRAEASTS